MSDHITAGETVALFVVFVAPFLLAGAVIQYKLLRRANISFLRTMAVVAGAGLTALLLTIGFLYLEPKVLPDPDRFGFGGPLLVPAFVAVAVTTFIVRLFARRR